MDLAGPKAKYHEKFKENFIKPKKIYERGQEIKKI